MSAIKITKMVAGKEVEVPPEKVWNSISKVIHLARLASFRGNEDDIKYQKWHESRVAFLKERLEDLQGLTFHEIE